MKTKMILAALVLVAATVYGQQPANPLIGAWRVTEFSAPDGATISSPQPGLYIFARQHYSFGRIQGTRPLPDYPSNDKATPAQKVEAFDALYFNTGTYTVKGNTLSTVAMVAKSKFAIGGGGNRYEFTVSGNTLTLTQRPSGAVLKLTRLE